MRFTVRICTVAMLSMLPGLACRGADGFTSPSDWTLRVSVTTRGIDQDVNGYRVLVSGASSHVAQVDTIGTASFSIAPGSYEVRLEDLAPNCSADGPAVLPVEISSYTIAPREIARVTLPVVCYAATATIEVFAASTGRDFPLPGYTARVTPATGWPTWTVPANVVTQIPFLPAGTYAVTLEALPDHCATTGEGTHTITVTTGGLSRDVGRVTFAVVCQAVTGDIGLAITSAGRVDSDGYLVRLDGELVMAPSYYSWYYGDYYHIAPLRLAPTGSHLLERVSPGEHTVELTDLAAGCTVNGTNPRTVTVALGVAAPVTFDVACP